jgi:hypothetical protein
MKEYKVYTIIKEEDKKNLFANTLSKYGLKLSALKSQSEAARTLSVKDISLETQVSILKDLIANHNQVALVLDTLLENCNFFLSLERKEVAVSPQEPELAPVVAEQEGEDVEGIINEAARLREFLNDLQEKKEELNEED